MQVSWQVFAGTATVAGLSIGQQQSLSWFAVVFIRHWQAAPTLAPTKVMTAKAATACRGIFPV
jgi:hypothetical protein